MSLNMDWGKLLYNVCSTSLSFLDIAKSINLRLNGCCERIAGSRSRHVQGRL